MNSRAPSTGWFTALLAVLTLGYGPQIAVADQQAELHRGADMASASHYVIKVTPTLAYLDVGSDGGALVGDEYVVVREQEGRLVHVGRVTVIRVWAGFSIAEISSVQIGEEIAVLHQVLGIEPWAQMDAGMKAMPGPPPQMAPTGPRLAAWTLLVGADLAKDVNFVLASNGSLAGVEGAESGAVGLRLSKAVARHLRLAMTYRLSGDPLSAAADVTQNSIEVDGHILLRAAGRGGPYFGAGVGLHRLSRNSDDETGIKVGYNFVAGLDKPLGSPGWSLVLEAGYQKVHMWNNQVDIDASHVRAYVGLSHDF